MRQSRVISETSFTFVSIREFMVLCFLLLIEHAFQIQGFIRLYFASLFPDLRQ